ncbi:hypothetical protein [Pseudomonas viridiflava]|uniref:hypothetical protein n=1 Tax=Pseudomonas viridiflava TaxID=33069 RepID=UPI0013CE6A9F|nr:hypothetical protein [Pseudomonas viridiflava]
MSGNKKKGSKSALKDNPATSFKRVLHAARDLRYGVGLARASAEPSQIPGIVKTLGSQQIYKNLFAPVTFPKRLKDYPARRRLKRISTIGEIIWTASVLGLFTEDLARYVHLKTEFHEHFYNGHYELAEKVLDKIQFVFGYSLWLIHSKLNLLQNAKGLKAQKDFLEELLSAGSPSQIVTWVSYYLSLQAEATVSFTDFSDEVNHMIGTGELSDFVIRKLLPLESNLILDPATPISWDEPHCLIDRFETLIAMIVLHYARNSRSGTSDMLSALTQLERIGDRRVCRILRIARGERVPADSNFIYWADLYTQGNYKAVIEGESEILELIARAYACSNVQPVLLKPTSIKQTIIQLMLRSLTFSSDRGQSDKALKKMALACAGHHYADQIAAFLGRDHAAVFTSTLSDLEIINALTGPDDNPWSTSVFNNFMDLDWADALKERFPVSSALVLSSVIKNGSAVPLLEKMELPNYRLAAYEGHANMVSGNYPDAIICYKRMAMSEVKYVSDSARVFLFDAYMAMDDYQSAMYLVVDHCMESPSAARAYPVDTLVTTCTAQAALREDIGLAILIFIAIKNNIGKFERDLSDTYENVLGAYGVARPSDLVALISEQNSAYVIFFLKNVCVPRLMDDTTLFDSLDEIDGERISVCQQLLQLDPVNEQSYLSEIRIITRDNNVAKLLEQVQSSKIFVDEDGIKQVLESSLVSSFARYKELLNSPTLAYQAEKLSKLLLDMINSTNDTDIKSLKLPATELEGLFRSMLMECVYQFAFNPAYGLDTHVSTTIRHGSFEGHLRSPLAIEDLLCIKSGGEYVLSDSWSAMLSDWEKPDVGRVLRALGKFSSAFEDLIAVYLKEKLHMKTVDLPQGLFGFDAASRMSGKVMDTITTNTDFDALCDKLISYCWDLTEISLNNIRHELKLNLTGQMSSHFEMLLHSIELENAHHRVAPLIDSIVRARTAFQVAVTDVAEWFKRPSNLARDPFDLELAVHVALQQVKNCYVKTPIVPTLDINVSYKIHGSMLDGLCEIFFILLQNVIIHGGVQNEPIAITLTAKSEKSRVIIECSNKLSDNVSIEDRRDIASLAMKSYERDSALRSARQEGGSGLSKVWRIAEFDLRASHELTLYVGDGGIFKTSLVLNSR